MENKRQNSLTDEYRKKQAKKRRSSKTHNERKKKKLKSLFRLLLLLPCLLDALPRLLPCLRRGLDRPPDSPVRAELFSDGAVRAERPADDLVDCPSDGALGLKLVADFPFGREGVRDLFGDGACDLCFVWSEEIEMGKERES